ncbi:helix-turn-helix domain-containing protein [Marinomonas sp. 2405UD68-3]|uniref:helix-turn-helix domain-containing protein n=1 Tax=Marinomonas sp. 2405UD68-3 TaxID=3391835 RepID=UPI0039C8F32B
MIDQSKNALAHRLKTIRKSKGLTLSEVEKRCGVTASTISKIENESISPTYANLLRLVKGLEVDMVDIVSNNKTVNTTKTRRSITYSGKGSEYSVGTHDYRILCNDLSDKKMIPMLATIRAKSINELSSKKSDYLATHDGEEVLYIVSGQVILHTECYTPVTLNPGDCAYIDSTMGHICLKGSKEDAVVFWVCSDNHSLSILEPKIE